MNIWGIIGSVFGLYYVICRRRRIEEERYDDNVNDKEGRMIARGNFYEIGEEAIGNMP